MLGRFLRSLSDSQCSSPTILWRGSTPPVGRSQKHPRYKVDVTLLLMFSSGRTGSSNGMIFGAAYSHTDMLKMGYSPASFQPRNVRVSSNSTLITAPPTAVNNLTIPTSYSDFMDQTEDGTIRDYQRIIIDWTSNLDDPENAFVSRRPKQKPLLSIEHRAEPSLPARTNVTYPVIQASQPPATPNGIKQQVANIVRG